MITFFNQTTERVKATNDDDVDNYLRNGWDVLSTAANAGDNPQFTLMKSLPVQETNYHNSSIVREYHS